MKHNIVVCLTDRRPDTVKNTTGNRLLSVGVKKKIFRVLISNRILPTAALCVIIVTTDTKDRLRRPSSRFCSMIRDKRL